MTNPHISQFPNDFTWGVATSSFQIEGSTFVDGRGESIWDRFCATEGKVKNNDHGEIACDHYTLFEKDIELMKSLGVQSYRFSIAWPRILPANGHVGRNRDRDDRVERHRDARCAPLA